MKAVVDRMNKDCWVQGQNIEKHKKTLGLIFQKFLLNLLFQLHGFTEVQGESRGHKLVNQTKAAGDQNFVPCWPREMYMLRGIAKS